MRTGNESDQVIDWLYWDIWFAGWTPHGDTRNRRRIINDEARMAEVRSAPDWFYASRKKRQREQDARDEAENQRIWERYRAAHPDFT